MGTYISQQDLESATSPETVLAIFEFGQSGVPDSVAVDDVIDRAETEVNSYLPNNYTVPLPAAQTPTSKAIKMCVVDYAVCYMFEKHPEYARLYAKDNEARFNRAKARMDRVVASVQRLYDLTKQPEPKNVGGITYDEGPRLLVTSANGSSNSGDL